MVIYELFAPGPAQDAGPGGQLKDGQAKVLAEAWPH
jgi:hypothetical protein